MRPDNTTTKGKRITDRETGRDKEQMHRNRQNRDRKGERCQSLGDRSQTSPRCLQALTAGSPKEAFRTVRSLGWEGPALGPGLPFA
jgi:hypothetical protein